MRGRLLTHPRDPACIGLPDRPPSVSIRLAAHAALHLGCMSRQGTCRSRFPRGGDSGAVAGARRPLTDMPSNDAKWIIGTLGALLVALGGILIAQNAGLTARVDRIETRLEGLDTRLRAVEVALGQVDRRMAALERTMLSAGE